MISSDSFFGRPHVKDGAFQGLARRVGDLPVVVAGLAGLLAADVCAQRQFGRAFPEKRTQDRGLGGRDFGRVGFERGRTARLLQGHDQHGNPQRVRQQDEFLALFIAHLAAGGEELYGCHPLLRLEVHVLHKGVGMLDQRGQHLLEARIWAVSHALYHRLGEVFAFKLQLGHGLVSCYLFLGEAGLSNVHP